MRPERYSLESVPKPKIALIQIAPGMTADMIDSLTAGSNAVVLTVYATGTSPQSLNGVIRKRTQEGIPVFLVSDNPGDAHGILKEAYGPQQGSRRAGAIAIEKVNSNDIEMITTVIESEYKKGKRGKELGKAVKQKFAYRSDEPKPVPGWENPAEIDEQERIYRQTLKRQDPDITDEELDEIIKKWRG